MRILVIGAYDYNGAQFFKHTMDSLASRLIQHHEAAYLKTGLVVATGKGTKGTESLAREWAEHRMDTELEVFPAMDWKIAIEAEAAAAVAFLTQCRKAACMHRQPHANHIADLRYRYALMKGHSVVRYGWDGVGVAV